jgi:hypothetical protein
MQTQVLNREYRDFGGIEGELFFEEVLEGLPGVVGARGRDRGSGNLGRLGVGGGCGVFFNGHAKLVELAIILGVFGSNALGDGLGALELSARIEKTALLAAVQFKLAFGTLAVGIEAGSEDCAAIRATASRDGANHARRAWAELIGARSALGRLAILILFPLGALFRVAVTAVTVLAIHKRLRPDAMPECNCDFLEFGADAHSSLVCIRSDCYTRPTAQS